jgi:hypothetical protein
MKHYRILELKISEAAILSGNINKKQYKIQYLKKFIFGLFYWKCLDNTIYDKYEEAFSEIKKVIIQDDYDTPELGYHYIDAYKIFKNAPGSPKEKEIKDIFIPPTNNTSKINKSTFNSDSTEKKINKSVFIPKQK